MLGSNGSFLKLKLKALPIENEFAELNDSQSHSVSMDCRTHRDRDNQKLNHDHNLISGGSATTGTANVTDQWQQLKKLVSERRKPYVVSIEGNIGSGKSTLLEYFQQFSCVQAIKEPVDQWTDIRGYNALQLLYDDPNRWSFSFNHFAMLTRLNMLKDNFLNTPVKMLERSLYSTRYVFVENSYRSGYLSDVEYGVLTDWFNFVHISQQLKVNLFVYLRTSPDVCYERLRKRNRKEEASVPMDLIKNLHQLHEDWLINQTFGYLPEVLILDANHDLPKMNDIYKQYKEKILCCKPDIVAQ